MPAGIHLSKALIAAAVNAIGGSPQTLAQAGALSLPTPTLDTQRRVSLASLSNNSGTNFTITGLTATGLPRSETIAGPPALAVSSSYDYLTVTSITADAAASGIRIGTNATGSTDWKLVDLRRHSLSMSVACTVSGTVTYALETTNSSVLDPSTLPIIQDSGLGSLTGNAVWTPVQPVRAWRLTVTAGTGTVFADAQQTGEV